MPSYPVRSLSAFPFASGEFGPEEGRVTTEDADIYKRWVWMISSWVVGCDCSVLRSDSETPHTFNTGINFNAGSLDGAPGFSDERQILNWKGMRATYTEEVDSGVFHSLSVELATVGTWGDVFDESGAIIHAAPGSYSLNLRIDLHRSDEEGSTHCVWQSAPTVSQPIGSFVTLDFDGITTHTNGFYETDAEGTEWDGVVTVGVFPTDGYWGYDGRFNTTTGAPL